MIHSHLKSPSLYSQGFVSTVEKTKAIRVVVLNCTSEPVRIRLQQRLHFIYYTHEDIHLLYLIINDNVREKP